MESALARAHEGRGMRGQFRTGREGPGLDNEARTERREGGLMGGSTPNKCLHIGSGSGRIPGFENLDIDGSLPGVDIVGDVRDLSSIRSESFGSIYLSHILEHIAVADVEGVLSELHRILAPGGTIRISVPDLDKICRYYVANLEWFIPPHSPWLGLFYGGQRNEFDFHKGGFNFAYLKYLLERAGFSGVEEVGPSVEYGVLDGSFASRPFGLISVTVAAEKGARTAISAEFRLTGIERALVTLEGVLDRVMTVVTRTRLELIRRRRRRALG